jgi:hypothetical protein
MQMIYNKSLKNIMYKLKNGFFKLKINFLQKILIFTKLFQKCKKLGGWGTLIGISVSKKSLAKKLRI